MMYFNELEGVDWFDVINGWGDNVIDRNLDRSEGTKEVTAVPLIYGEKRTEPTRIFSSARSNFTDFIDSKNNGTVFPYVYTIANGEIEGVNQIYIDGNPILLTRQTFKNGTIPATAISPLFQNIVESIEVRTGRPNQTPLSTISKWDSNWNETKRGDNIALIGIVFRSPKQPDINADVFGTEPEKLELPNYKVEVSTLGTKVKRLEASLRRGYSVNPVSCLYDLLTNKHYGAGIDPSRIDLESFIELAKYCQDNNYKVASKINTSKSVKAIAKDLLLAFNGAMYDDNGLIKLTMGRPSESKMHFDESNIYGKLTLTKPKMRKVNNMVIINYNKNGEDRTLSIPSTPTAEIIADGVLNPKKIDVHAVDDPYGLLRIGNIAYKRLKPRNIIEFKAGIESMLVTIGDVITVSDGYYELNKNKFVITELQRDLEKFGFSSIKATEYRESDFNGNESAQHPDRPEDKDTLTPKQPLELKFKLLTSNVNALAELTWQPAEDANANEYRIEYKKASSDTWETLGRTRARSFRFGNLPLGKWDFAVRAVNKFGYASEPKIISGIDVCDSREYPAPSNIKIANNQNSVSVSTSPDWVIQWDDVRDLKIEGESTTYSPYFDCYELTIKSGDTVKRRVKCADASHTYAYSEAVKDGLARNLTFEVRFVAKSGAKSAPGILCASNQQAQPPSGIKIEGGVHGLRIQFERPKELDFAGVQLHISKDKGFTPSASTLDQTITNTNAITKMFSDKDTGSYYVKLAAFDVFGIDSLVYSREFSTSITSFDELLPDISESNLSESLLNKISSIDGNTQQIQKEAKARADAINKEQEARTKASNALMSHVKQLSSKAESSEKITQGLIKRLDKTQADLNGKVSTDSLSNLIAESGPVKSLNQRMESATAELNGKASASSLKTVSAKAESADRKVNGLRTVIDDIKADLNGKVSTDSLSNLIAESGPVKSLNQRMESATAELNGKASALTVETLQTAVSGIEGQVEEFKKVSGDVEGMKSEYVIKTNANGVVAGIGMMSQSGPDKNKSSITLRADSVYIAGTKDDDKGKIPFTVSNGLVAIDKAAIKQVDAGALVSSTIAATTDIRAGTGNHTIALHGGGRALNGKTVLLSAGSQDPTTAPLKFFADGSIYAEHGTFKGTVLAEKIMGDVAAGNAWEISNVTADYRAPRYISYTDIKRSSTLKTQDGRPLMIKVNEPSSKRRFLRLTLPQVTSDAIYSGAESNPNANIQPSGQVLAEYKRGDGVLIGRRSSFAIIHGCIFRDGNHQTKYHRPVLFIEIPAHTTGSVHLTLQLNGSMYQVKAGGQAKISVETGIMEALLLPETNQIQLA